MKRIVLLAFVVLLATGAGAHDPGLGTAEVTLAPREIKIVVGYAPADWATLLASKGVGTVAAIGAELSSSVDFGRLAGPSAVRTAGKADLRVPRGGAWSTAEFERLRPAIEAVATRLWRVEREGQVLTPSDLRARLQSSNSILIDFAYSDEATGALQIEDLAIASLPAGHRDYLSVTAADGKVAVERLVDAKTGAMIVPGAEAAGKTATPFWAFLRLGIMHIWTGYDHLLFLFGLLVVCRSFRSIAAIISCFTVAHSITLALSTLNIVTVPSRFIEPAIAASILYVGIENLVRRGAEPHARWVLTFLFGLIHGFGFASALKELGVGSDGRSIALPLFTFNFGVEIGQIAIAAAVLPIVWQLRKRPMFVLRGVPALSLVVALMGLAWLLQRTVLA